MVSLLVVDDEPDILQFMRLVLELEEYKVITARNGLEAVEAYVRHSPDIVIMDVNMPVMNGFDAREKILRINKNARIVLCTASPTVSNDNGTAKIPTIHKPFDFITLLEKIRSGTLFRN